MITEHDLQEAIAECNGVKNPSANTCLKLAAYYTVHDHLFGRTEQVEPLSGYSGASEPAYNGKSEFAQLLRSKDSVEVMGVLDELMDTLHVINPRLYDGVIAKLSML